MPLPIRVIATAIFFLLLNACSGGGSSTGGNSPPVSVTQNESSSDHPLQSTRVAQTNQETHQGCDKLPANNQGVVLSAVPYNLQGLASSTAINASFCSIIDEANENSFVIYGSQSGLHHGSYSGANSRMAQFTPDIPFLPGEIVS